MLKFQFLLFAAFVTLASAAPRYLVIPLDDYEYLPSLHRVARALPDELEAPESQAEPVYQPRPLVPVVSRAPPRSLPERRQDLEPVGPPP